MSFILRCRGGVKTGFEDMSKGGALEATKFRISISNFDFDFKRGAIRQILRNTVRGKPRNATKRRETKIEIRKDAERR